MRNLEEEWLELMKSIEEPLRKLGDDYSVPLIAHQLDGHPRLVGTGWGFRCELEWFLITAAHVVDDLFPGGLRDDEQLPDSRLLVPCDGGRLRPLLGRWSTTKTYDVAILRLAEPGLVSAHWTPVTILDFAPREPDGEFPCYHVAGWPVEYSKRTKFEVAGEKFRFTARAEPVSIGDEFDGERRIRFPLHLEAFGTFAGQGASPPRLNGISGSPVWRVFEDGGRYRPRLAGVQVACLLRRDVWLVDVVRWGAVRMLIEHAVPGLFSSAERLSER